jgi:dsRNA-specific ribonuclease
VGLDFHRTLACSKVDYLFHLRAEKFFSDITESISGAIYLNSRGSIRAGEGFLGKMGLLKNLQRLTTGPSIEVMHPKEKMGVESSNAKLAYQTSIENGVDGKGSYRGKSEIDGNVFAISDERLSKPDC